MFTAASLLKTVLTFSCDLQQQTTLRTSEGKPIYASPIHIPCLVSGSTSSSRFGDARATAPNFTLQVSKEHPLKIGDLFLNVRDQHETLLFKKGIARTVSILSNNLEGVVGHTASVSAEN